MKIISFIFFLLLAHLFSFSQNCTDTSYKKLFSSPTGILYNEQYKILKNGESILTGNFMGTQINDTCLYIIKLSTIGKKIWAKKIKLNNYTLYMKQFDLIETNDGSLIINYPYNESKIGLIKLTANGVLVWSKIIELTDCDGYSEVSVYYYKGKLNFLMNYDGIGNINANSVTSLFQLDENANLIWSKLYNADCSYTKPMGLIGVKDSLILIGQSFFNPYCSNNWQADNKAALYAMKVNEIDGALGNSRCYSTSIENDDSWNSGFAPGSAAKETQVVKSNIGEYFFTTHPPLHINPQKIRFDENLKMYEGVMYSPIQLIEAAHQIVINEQGETLVSFKNIFSTNSGSTYFGKLNRNNISIREKKITSDTLNNYAGQFVGAFAPNKKYINILTNYKNAQDTYLQLMQLNNEEKNSDCFGEDTNFLNTTPVTLTPIKTPLFTSAQNMPAVVQNGEIATLSDLPIVEESICENISVCKNIKIVGIDTICSTTQQYTWKASINKTCLKHVFWNIDSSAINSILPIDDTTVQIKFKKSWSGYLYASINSCTQMIDSIKLNVFASPIQINLGNDTSICTPNFAPISLTAPIGFYKYIWQDGSNKPIFTALKFGQYNVAATNYCHQIFTDTINIIQKSSTAIFLGNDTSICANKPIQLNAGNYFTNYAWNTGEKTQMIIADKAQNYIVQAINSNGCISADTILIKNVYPAPAIQLPKKWVVCSGQNNVLKLPSGYTSYLWQDGSTDSFYTIKKAGIYKIKVTNSNGCTTTDSTIINQVIEPYNNILPADTAICESEPLVITTHQLFDHYLWSTGSNLSSITVKNPSIYFVSVIDKNNCIGIDSIHVSYKDCPETIYFPNSFSPNNDGLNDVFKPTVSKPLQYYHLSIYNRYGQKLFESSSPLQGWDGSYLSALQHTGTYIYQCNYQFKNSPTKYVKGYCLLLK